MNEYEQNIEVMKDLRARLDKVLSANNVPTEDYKHPDPIKHKYISFVKSFFRIAAGVALVTAQFAPHDALAFVATGGGLLILAEILGIAEEMV